MTMKISVGGGLFAEVDAADFEWLSAFSWHTFRANSQCENYYAVNSPPREKGKPRKKIRMHRLITGITDPNIAVDHIDGNGLNNTRANLRPDPARQNAQNTRKKTSAVTSRFKGVNRCRGNLWKVSCCGSREERIIGYITDEYLAAHFYDLMAHKFHGEYARVNFPELTTPTLTSEAELIEWLCIFFTNSTIAENATRISRLWGYLSGSLQGYRKEK